jgi:hypothetical protein
MAAEYSKAARVELSPYGDLWLEVGMWMAIMLPARDATMFRLGLTDADELARKFYPHMFTVSEPDYGTP